MDIRHEEALRILQVARAEAAEVYIDALIRAWRVYEMSVKEDRKEQK